MPEPKLIEIDGGVGPSPFVVDKGRIYEDRRVRLDPQDDRIILDQMDPEAFRPEAAKPVAQAND